MSMISPEPLFRTVALIIAVVATGFAIYDLVRIIQKISQATPTTGSIAGRVVTGLRSGHQRRLGPHRGGDRRARIVLLCAIGGARRS